MGIAGEVFWAAFSPDELRDLCVNAGLREMSSAVREALPGEIPVRRIYVTAERT
jgi:hypothetical protein